MKQAYIFSFNGIPKRVFSSRHVAFEFIENEVMAENKYNFGVSDDMFNSDDFQFKKESPIAGNVILSYKNCYHRMSISQCDYYE